MLSQSINQSIIDQIQTGSVSKLPLGVHHAKDLKWLLGAIDKNATRKVLQNVWLGIIDGTIYMTGTDTHIATGLKMVKDPYQNVLQIPLLIDAQKFKEAIDGFGSKSIQIDLLRTQMNEYFLALTFGSSPTVHVALDVAGEVRYPNLERIIRNESCDADCRIVQVPVNTYADLLQAANDLSGALAKKTPIKVETTCERVMVKSKVKSKGCAQYLTINVDGLNVFEYEGCSGSSGFSINPRYLKLVFQIPVGVPENRFRWNLSSLPNWNCRHFQFGKLHDEKAFALVMPCEYR